MASPSGEVSGFVAPRGCFFWCYAAQALVTPEQSSALLLAHLAGARRDEARAIGQLGELLVAQYREASAAWPAVKLTPERYLVHLAERIAARADEPVERVLGTMPAADLYLAAACSDGDPAALTAFRDDIVPSLRQALGKIGMPGPTIDETVQRVMTMLFVGEGDGAPQIAGYRGRGTLRSWLRTIGVRTGRRLLGTEAAKAPSADDSDLPGAITDPQIALLRERHRDQVRHAFSAAFAQLTERQRNVLRQYHLDGLTIDQLAALYKVNRATAARWVAAAREAVSEATRAHLTAALGGSTSEIDSIIRLVRSQIDLSLRELKA
jgi:RNA polymerase sigma-70 factor (ECF subfamily)